MKNTIMLHNIVFPTQLMTNMLIANGLDGRLITQSSLWSRSYGLSKSRKGPWNLRSNIWTHRHSSAAFGLSCADQRVQSRQPG